MNKDGTVTLYLQNASPGADKEANWLPTQKSGRWYILLRSYAPGRAAIESSFDHRRLGARSDRAGEVGQVDPQLRGPRLCGGVLACKVQIQQLSVAAVAGLTAPSPLGRRWRGTRRRTPTEQMTGSRITGLLAGALALFAFGLSPASARQATPDDSGKSDEARRVTHDTVGKAGEDDIARESENPIGNLTILPFENYTNFGFGPNKGTQNILEFEPVVPAISLRTGPSSPARSFPQSEILTCRRHRAYRGRSRRRIFPRFSRPATRSTAGPGASVRSSRSRPPPARPSAPASGASARPPWSSRQRIASSPACWSTRSGRSAASTRARAASAMRLSLRSASSTIISAAAGSSTPRRSSPPTKTAPDGNGRFRSARRSAGSSSWGELPVKLSIGGYYNVVTPQYGAKWTLQTVVAVIF